MLQALELAGRAAQSGEVPVGALLVWQGQVIGEGWNQPIGSHDPTAHAEIMAIRAAAARLKNYRLSGATLYVTIEPCTMCAGAIIHSRVARLVYGATEPKSGVAESNGCLFSGEHLNHRLEITGGVLAEQCSQQMSQFFQMRRQAKKDRTKSQQQTVEDG
jgi:tRNA(adenine34) deaminase